MNQCEKKISTVKGVLRIIAIGFLITTSSNATAKPIIASHIATPFSDLSQFGVKIFCNDQWSYTTGYADAQNTRDKLGRMQAAGVHVVINDGSNWSTNALPPYTITSKLPVIEAECAARGMKQTIMIASNSPSAPFGPGDIVAANYHAKWIWDNYAQRSTYFIYKNKPLLVVYAPGQATFNQEYDAWPLKGTSEDYLNKFTIGNCYGGGWGWGLNESAPDNSVRYAKPCNETPGTTPWTQRRYKVDEQEWEQTVRWGLEATDICVLSSYDDTLDGSFWAPADTSGVPDSQTPRQCNINPSGDWWMYYDVVKRNIADVSNIGGFNNMITSLDLMPETLSAMVSGSEPVTHVAFTLLEDDYEFPAGATASVTNTTGDNRNPTAVFTTDKAGTYKVKLEISAGGTTQEQIAEITVYADACQARKESAGGLTANYYDRDGNCVVDLGDFVLMAAEWMDDRSMKAAETYIGSVMYLPKDVFDARIEAESVDPSAVSDPPVTDSTGIRIVAHPSAIGGGEHLGFTGSGQWADYAIDLPAAGTYDLHLYTSAHDEGAILNFGTPANPSLYGTISDLPVLGWYTYHYTVHPGALTFPASGPTTLRISWSGTAGRNLDWFTLVHQP